MTNTVTLPDIRAYCEAHPGLQITDVLKYIHQSCFGCAHLVADFDTALHQIRQEAVCAPLDRDATVEELPGAYCRLHLKALNEGLSPETLTKLFLLSAKESSPATPADGSEASFGSVLCNEPAYVKSALQAFIAFSAGEDSPFSRDAVENEISRWKGEGFPPLSHSDIFKALYHPAYRVIKKEYARLLPLMKKLDCLMLGPSPLTVAIDGRCASGKTTLADILCRVYDCDVFRMDDFFLRPEQRTKERLSAPGGNVDYERFEAEVLLPLAAQKTVCYRRYDCQSRTLLAPVDIPFRSLNIIEGSYSLHPRLRPYYTLKVLSDVSAETQRARIEKRNTPAMAQRFFAEWIPLEEAYFAACGVREAADTVIEE